MDSSLTQGRYKTGDEPQSKLNEITRLGSPGLAPVDYQSQETENRPVCLGCEDTGPVLTEG
ncbi:MAG TPA: hypothetical protein DEF45_18845 [Rhodopirellula sp.]|nr:hypothetical protein [Rhodopirellula sp.]